MEKSCIVRLQDKAIIHGTGIYLMFSFDAYEAKINRCRQIAGYNLCIIIYAGV